MAKKKKKNVYRLKKGEKFDQIYFIHYNYNFH